MKTVFDQSTREELVKRINALSHNSEAKWGRMTVYQAMKHCTIWEEMLLRNQPTRRVFAGRLFGRIALKKVMKDDSPLSKNTPTIPELIISEKNGDTEALKLKWTGLINAWSDYSTAFFIHPFFGKMTREQVGYMVYKHNDHHLRQFGC